MTARILLAVLFLAAGIGGGLVPWTLPRSALAEDIAPQLATILGITSLTHGEGRLTILPTPRIEVAAVAAEGAAGRGHLTADVVGGALRLLPLVAGRLELAEVTVTRPRLTVSAAAGEPPSPAAALFSALPTPPENQPVLGGLGRIILLDGRITIATPTGGPPEVTVSSVNAVLRRSRGENQYDLVLAAMWQGQAMEWDASRLDLAALARGDMAALSVSLRSEALSASFEGRGGWGRSPMAEGSLTVTSSAIERAFSWLGMARPLSLSGPLKATGTVRLTPDALALSAARIVAKPGTFDGAMALRLAGETVQLSGTLATDALDVTPAIQPLLAERSSDGGWNRDALDLSWLPAGDVDLRLSAGRLWIGPSEVTNAALSILARGGRTDVNLGSGTLAGGSVKGRLSVLAGGRTIPELRLQAGVERVDLATLLQPWPSARRLSGTGSGTLVVETAGDSIAALMRGLEGRANLVVRQGEVNGINLPELLRRIERRPLTATDARGGRTPFETATLAVRIGRGVADIVDGALQSPAARMTWSGQIGLGDRSLAVAGTVQSVEPAGRDPTVLGFDLGGSFDDPVLTPDARSLIRRSGAAAPLFDRRTQPIAPEGAAVTQP